MTTDVVVNEDALVVESIRMLLVSAEVNEDELKYGFDSDHKIPTPCSDNDVLVLRAFNSSPTNNVQNFDSHVHSQGT